MNILLVNDDGWGADGLLSLENVAGQFGSITVVAPEDPQSGISHQLTLDRPLTLNKRGENSFSLDGTPADCVRIGLTQINREFDWVFSGINNGANLGTDVFVSGTVAAAREAAIFGVNAIAFSQHRRRMKQPFDWTLAESMSERLIEDVLSKVGVEPMLINVNFPDASQQKQPLDAIVIECELDLNPLPWNYNYVDGQLHYGGVYSDRKRESGRDIDVCFSGNISFSRLRLS